MRKPPHAAQGNVERVRPLPGPPPDTEPPEDHEAWLELQRRGWQATRAHLEKRRRTR